MTNCNCRCRCTIAAAIASAIIGILAAFFQITAVITVAPVFFWVVFGIAIVYLAILIIATALAEHTEACGCLCFAMRAILLGILGSILFALILLAFDIAAASIIGAILLGLLLFFFSLMLTNSACLVRSLSDCGN